jgi:FtsZ-interacting cell division protein ZipA
MASMSSNQLIWIVVALLVVVAIAVAAASVWRNGRAKRERALRERFGPEYDRLLQEQHGDAARVAQELESRAQRVRKLNIKELPEGERRRFAQAWQRTQERFVDTPSEAVGSAHQLVQEVMRTRGYPIEESGDIEQRVADLSVDHASVVQHYRAAHALHSANPRSNGDTEQLRQAIVHYRALFAELLGAHEDEDEAPSSRLAHA